MTQKIWLIIAVVYALHGMKEMKENLGHGCRGIPVDALVVVAQIILMAMLTWHLSN